MKKMLALVAVSSVLALASAGASAQQSDRQLRAGQDYTVLAKSFPQEKGRLDVVYFFWYGSPWSREFDGMIRNWAAKNAPPQVRFSAVPAVIADEWGYGSRVFYALKAMGLDSQLSGPLMGAIQSGVVKYRNPSTLMAWLRERGADTAKFAQVINSPLVKAQASSSPSATYLSGVQSVPAVLVGGKYLFTVSPNGDVADLMDKVNFAVEANVREMELRQSKN